VRPPAILPIAIPVPEIPPDVNMIVPGANGTAPTVNQLTAPTTEPAAPAQDCSGANAGLPRCLPNRWQVRQRPQPRNDAQPAQESPAAAPRQE
jgi:hypothetical protein